MFIYYLFNPLQTLISVFCDLQNPVLIYTVIDDHWKNNPLNYIDCVNDYVILDELNQTEKYFKELGIFL